MRSTRSTQSTSGIEKTHVSSEADAAAAGVGLPAFVTANCSSSLKTTKLCENDTFCTGNDPIKSYLSDTSSLSASSGSAAAGFVFDFTAAVAAAAVAAAACLMRSGADVLLAGAEDGGFIDARGDCSPIAMASLVLIRLSAILAFFLSFRTF